MSTMIALFFFLLLFPSFVSGAIVHEGSNSVTGNSTTDSSVSVQCGTGSNRVLLGWLAVRSGTPTISAWTYNSVGLTSVTSVTHGGNGLKLWLYRLNAPTTSSNTLAVTISSATDHILGGMCFSGVDQTTPLDTPVTSQADTDTASDNVSSATGDLVANTYATSEDATSLVTGSGQTQRFIQTNVAGVNLDAEGTTEPGAATVTMSGSWTTTSLMTHIAVNINAAASQSVVPVLLQKYRRERE